MYLQLIYSVTSTPATGSLFQLSQVFSSYGYEPKTGVPILEPNTHVTGSNNRILYTRPVPDLAGVNMVSITTFLLLPSSFPHCMLCRVRIVYLFISIFHSNCDIFSSSHFFLFLFCLRFSFSRSGEISHTKFRMVHTGPTMSVSH